MTPGEIFPQPFTQLFGPTPPVFEGFKSLNVNDIIQWLVLLVHRANALGPSQYATFIATLNPDNNRETVGFVANKLRNYESIISGPMQAQVSAMAKELREKIEEVTQKMEEMKEEMRRNSSHVAPVRVTGPRVRAQQPPARERGYTHELTCGSFSVTMGKTWEDFLHNGYYKDPKGLRWAFGIAAVEAEGIKKLNSLPGLSENPSAVGLLKVEEQRVPVATSMVHRRQYRTNRDAVIPIHKMIRELETQGVVSKTHSPFNSPIWPVRKPDGEWRLTVDYRALNEVTPPLSAAVPDMLELQYELESRQQNEGAWGDSGRPLGFWSRSYRGSEANYTPKEKEILAAYEGVQAASEVIGTEAQLLLAPRLPVLGWMFKGKVPSTHHATNATWSKWIALITQRARTGNPNRPGILEVITNWPEGENFGLMDEEEQEQVTCAKEGPAYNQLPAEETCYALFTEGSCSIVGMNRKWKAAVWSPTLHTKEKVIRADATYKWAQDRGVDLTMDSISQVIHDCETCAAIKQAKRVKPLWYGGRWSKYKYGEAWQIDYITLPQTRQGKHYMLTMVEATTGWLETYPVLHTTARNTILGLEKQIL
ncbi:hypothetical protein DUI87_03938 [Hirundo rustica rustica]|uniref:Integrase catalytic domain-containing protein n=1 Tax=Hirundo rustica rustica TaxID=333673 RepID=A0A3M0L8L1_HIRRU|nr:hypothetical protein DUI87_03938 [Hirundo rustica rustica]